MSVNDFNVIDAGALCRDSLIAGVPAGKRALQALTPAVPSGDAPVVFDLAGIELVTASAFRESFLALIRLLRSTGRAAVVANATDSTIEEALISVEASRDVIVFARLVGTRLVDVTVRGELEPKHAKTLQIVLDRGKADARTVCEVSGEDKVPTVWNNRLVALHKLALLTEQRDGKTKIYRPAFEGMQYGR